MESAQQIRPDPSSPAETRCRYYLLRNPGYLNEHRHFVMLKSSAFKLVIKGNAMWWRECGPMGTGAALSQLGTGPSPEVALVPDRQNLSEDPKL